MTVRFEERGKGNPGPIIMVHGAGGSSATWFLQVKHLSKQFHIIAIDLNGHGKTADRGGEDTLKSYLHDIDSIVTQYEKPVLCGHSMGGALTQLYALENEGNLKGIILVGTGARLKVNPIIFGLLDNDFEGFVTAFGEFLFHSDVDETLKETSMDEVRKCPSSITHRDFEFCNNFDIMETVSHINLPTLILVGDSDQLTPEKYSTYLADKIPNSQIHVLERAGHGVMMEQWKEFNDIVAKWYLSLG